jgi:hypothetical protein
MKISEKRFPSVITFSDNNCIEFTIYLASQNLACVLTIFKTISDNSASPSD